MTEYSFSISGVTSLILHHNNIVARDEMETKRKRMKGGKAGDDRSPPESWKGYLYVSESTGNICMPTENLLACILAGGVKVKVGGKETLKTHSQRVAFDSLDYDLFVNGKTIAWSDVEKIDGEFHEHYQATQQLGFRLSVKPVTVGTSKHIRVRPMFSNWALSGRFSIDDDDANIMNLSTLRDLFSTSGRLAGLGDWRPSSPKKPGQYGRFIAEVNRV